jgi:hypothetical protein
MLGVVSSLGADLFLGDCCKITPGTECFYVVRKAVSRDAALP